jgi:N-methylhydantoinase A
MPDALPFRPVRIAVDIGGTFVDAVEFDARTGQVRLHKSATTPEQPSRGVLAAIQGLDTPFGDIATFIHGTTLGLNAILQRRGARTGIITNEGFRDIFEIGRGDVPGDQMYNFQYQRPPSIVPRRLALGVRGRIDVRGEVIEDLDEAGVLAAGRVLVEQAGVQAIAITFLHSYLNPEHERRAAAILRDTFPGVSLSISSDLAREYREYERTSTTVLEAYIRPIFETYIGELERELNAAGFAGSFLITRSGGGAMTSAVAKRAPLLTVLSGPAGGIIGAAALGSLIDRPNLISFDVGGTSVDACVLLNGKPTEVYEARIENLPLLIPIYDIRTIGAGGGSIARVEGSMLRVGPQSAGADPGPLCYRKGGTAPTVTDAAIVLGYLSAREFLEGQIEIDEDAAVRGVEAVIAGPMGMDVIAAAAGIFNVMVSRTVGAIREITVERGLDPREFSLLAFGGAGPMIAPLLMREMGLKEVIIPRAPAGFSAWGMLMSDLEFDFSRTILTRLTAAAIAALPGGFIELEGRGLAVLDEQQVPEAQRALEHRLDLRYAGQEHMLTIRIETTDPAEDIARRFGQAHAEYYGHQMDAPIEIVNLRLRAIGRTEKPDLQPLPPTPGGPRVALALDSRPAYDFAARRVTSMQVFDRFQLDPGATITGPAIVVEGTATLVIHADQWLEVDSYGHLIIRRVTP